MEKIEGARVKNVIDQARRHFQLAVVVLAIGCQHSVVAEVDETGAAAATVLPTLLPSRLREETLGYRVTTAMAGTERTGTATLSFSKEWLTDDAEHQQAWRVDYRELPPLAPRGNVFILRAADLALLERHLVMPTGTFNLRFGAEAVSVEGDEIPLPVPVLANWDVAVLALPLAEGFETSAHTFEIPRLVRWRVAVEAVEAVTTPAGAFESYKVALTCLDDDALSATAWVSKDAPYRIVRRESAYMPMAPDSTMLIELASIEDGGTEAAEAPR